MKTRDLSIRQKLQWAGVAASATALLSAAIVFLTYDVYTSRQLLKQRIMTDAQIVGFNCVTALLFNDPSTATSTLSALKAEPQVEVAGIYDKAGQLFASYARQGEAALDPVPAPAPDPEPRSRFTANAFIVTHPISFDGQRIGSVVIRADLSEIRQRVVRYVGVVIVVLAGSLATAAFISRRAHQAIAGPIVHLASVASIVSTQKDYSVRAVANSTDEIGTLIHTFNEMLAQIEQQNEALRESQTLLERRVEERTNELEARSQELAVANKELEAFSYSVSHDLRAPLRGIDGFSRALLEEYDGKVLDGQGAHYLRRVRANTQRMAELIDDMLHLSRVTRADLIRRPVDLTRLARKIASDLEGRDAERHVEFCVEDGLTAEADSHLLAIVFENLMGNAWKFTARRADARVVVATERQGEEKVFFVRDNGAGFDMQYAGKLFGVFQRLHEAASFEGTGIGLATVQRIVHRHGGRIWAEASPGEGATFFFTLGET